MPSSIDVDEQELDALRAGVMRQSLCGMEAEIVDLVLRNSSRARWMEWLRVPLECASATGSLDAVKRLLAVGVETGVSTPTARPGPLLHAAAASGNAGVVEELVKAGADVHAVDSMRNDRTALHLAAAEGADAAVRALTSAGASVDVLDTRGWTPLHVAALCGNRGVVVFLLLKGANALRATTHEGDSPLHLAASHNHAGVIEDLLMMGNACVGCCNLHGQTALHVAARAGKLDACIALLRAGAAVGRVSSQGVSALDVAAWNGHTGRLLQILTAAEASADRKRRCSLALYYASKANKPNTINDLIALGANVDQPRSGGLTSLHYTAGRGQREATEALLKAGASVEARAAEGITPLHRACMFSQSSMVRLLLRWGANEAAVSHSNVSALGMVGTAATVPEHDERKALEGNLIRSLLIRAPGDRVWRRRGWLTVCRARWLTRARDKKKYALARALECAAMGNKRQWKGHLVFIASAEAEYVCPRASSPGEGQGARSEFLVLRLGRDSFLSEGVASMEKKRADPGRRFESVVERLLMLQEEGVFREVLKYL